MIFINFSVYLIGFQYLLFPVLSTINWLMSWPFLSLIMSLSSQLRTGRAESLLCPRGSWGPWEGQLKLGVLILTLLPTCLSQTRRSPEFFFPASLKQPKCNIPLNRSSDADSSVTFYSKGFYFVFFRICKVEINRNYIISSTGNIWIDSLNKSSSSFLFFVVFPWLGSWKWIMKWSLNTFKRF